MNVSFFLSLLKQCPSSDALIDHLLTDKSRFPRRQREDFWAIETLAGSLPFSNLGKSGWVEGVAAPDEWLCQGRTCCLFSNTISVLRLTSTSRWNSHVAKHVSRLGLPNEIYECDAVAVAARARSDSVAEDPEGLFLLLYAYTSPGCHHKVQGLNAVGDSWCCKDQVYKIYAFNIINVQNNFFFLFIFALWSCLVIAKKETQRFMALITVEIFHITRSYSSGQLYVLSIISSWLSLFIDFNKVKKHCQSFVCPATNSFC